VSSKGNAQMMVLDPAYLPTHPAPPGRATLLGVGALVSVVLGLLLALLSALLDDRIYDRVDLERLELLPVLGVVPRVAPVMPVQRGRRRV
jgi:capsular polysaccharide biosynthesis protein